MKINEIANISGITVRTLHYYDEIGLLKPSEVNPSGYRIYNDAALATLQQILFFRELDFSLSDIKSIIKNPSFDKREALSKHKELLLQKRTRLDGLLALIDTTIKGEAIMSFKEFDTAEIENTKKQYAAEAKQRWGETPAFAESEKKTNEYTDQQWQIVNGEGAAILQEFANSKNLLVECTPVQALVEKWQAYITANFYNCTKQILGCLGQMYIGDERFTQNIDKNGDGTAEFMAKAIDVYCSK